MQLLCGDIGGTKTLLQLVTLTDNEINVVAEQRFPSGAYASFDDILSRFLEEHVKDDTVAAACFGVAGPVQQREAGQHATITNLPWQMDSAALSAKYRLPHVALINDFEAVGYGIDALPASDVITLQAGEPLVRGNQLVVGAGTGLGVAQRIWAGGDYRVIPTEGGHADFGPADRDQLKLAECVMAREGRCSVEFVLSGPGLVNIFACLAEAEQQTEAEQYRDVMQADDRAAAIAAGAERGAPLARRAMALFVEIYGSQVGNFALATLPQGGVFIAGGIAAKIAARLQEGPFIQAFNAKGKMSALMQGLPVKLITNPAVGLMGSRVYAQRLAAG